MPVFVDTFREHGLPQVIRSDNGGPLRLHRPRTPQSSQRLVRSSGHLARDHRTGIPSPER
jgi:hypothetical protein